MSESDEREALKRVAFGRAYSPAAEARATEAQRRLVELDTIEAAARDAEEQTRRDAGAARERRSRRIRSRVVSVAAVAASLGVVAAVSVTLLTPAAPSADRPRPVASPTTNSVDLGPGTVAAGPDGSVGRASSGSAASAEHWFDDPQDDGDVIAQLPPEFDPASTRAVDSSVKGWQVFIARDVNGGFCVIVSETGLGPAGSGCATAEQFTSAGILLTVGVESPITVYWDGFDLTMQSAGSSSGS